MLSGRNTRQPPVCNEVTSEQKQNKQPSIRLRQMSRSLFTSVDPGDAPADGVSRRRSLSCGAVEVYFTVLHRSACAQTVPYSRMSGHPEGRSQDCAPRQTAATGGSWNASDPPWTVPPGFSQTGKPWIWRPDPAEAGEMTGYTSSAVPGYP